MSDVSVTQFAAYYFSEIPDETSVSGESWDRLERHLRLGETREPGEMSVGTTELTDGSIQIQIVADDIPLLVEAVLAVLDSRGLTIVANDHPVLAVRRDEEGRLSGVDDAAPIDEVDAAESWISVTTDVASGIDTDALCTHIGAALVRAQAVHADSAAIGRRLARLAESLSADDEDADILSWFAVRDNFVAVGYRSVDGSGDATAAADAELGVWRDPRTPRPDSLPGDEPITVDRAFLPTGLLRSRFPVLLRIRVDGTEHQAVGSITSIGRHQSVRSIPGIRGKVADVLRGLGLSEDSYGGRAALELLQTHPLAELMTTDSAVLTRRIGELIDAQTSRNPRFYARNGSSGGFASVLVFMPRELYSTSVRTRIVGLLERELRGGGTEFLTQLSHSPLAQLEVLMRSDADVSESIGEGLLKHLTDVVRTWSDQVRAVRAADPEVVRLLATVSDRYRDERDPADAAVDLPIAARLAPGELHVRLDRTDPAAWRFVLYLADRGAVLTDILPMLQSLGLTVLDEHPHTVDRPDGIAVGVYDFTVRPAPHVAASGRTIAPADPEADEDLDQRVADAFSDMWLGHTEVDALGELVLRAGLTSRTVAMIRTYARYLNQCGAGFAMTHVARVLGDHRAVTRGLVELFAATFDPDSAGPDRRERVLDEVRERIAEILSLDADRVVSALSAAIEATLRTNFYAASGDPAADIRPTIAVKLDTGAIPQAPQPRPKYEIYVYSPRVEGVHLRYGDVARGGLRWSDRREDFRTEVLGLVKAQAVKNAVIVPVGAKGGFVVRRPAAPTGDPVADREADRAEGIACYRAFIAALLQVTDDLDPATGAVRPPARVLRRDGDDPYLVVAADKGTAAFSDIANDVAAHYGFWLADAFASGGSVGYDHKAMGITARGAWESVKRHFRELGVDTQTEDFTAVGIGDMSGDVFGNGMLLSRHTRLVAAFDHRHVFIDPDPDAASSYAERARLFALPRSSWDDYDRALISEGGGVWSREQKRIDITPAVRAALGLPDTATAMSPPELIRAVLLAPVDLLFNGGIGTYVKASDEPDAAVGDKANDAIRVDGCRLRVKVVGEGGNLGVTQRGRIEADLAGVRINSDALDNSAGVDCSDHEVNIKVLLGSQISAGTLAADDRNDLLLSMTDDVAELVLADNVDQNAELGLARGTADDDVELHARMLAHLDSIGVDLDLEALPTPAALRRRRAGERQRGLTSPELATLMAHVKLDAKGRLLESGLPDNDMFDELASSYFPDPLREKYRAGIRTHRLRREIVTTVLVNRIVADGGMSHIYTLGETSGSDVDDVMRASVVAMRVFGIAAVIGELRSERVAAATIDDATRRIRGLLAAGSRWFLAHRPQPLAIAAETTRYRRVPELSGRLDDWLGRTAATAVAEHRAVLVAAGVRPALARAIAISPYRLQLLDVLDLAEISDRSPDEVGELLFAVVERFGIDALTSQIAQLEHGDRWTLLARLSLRDELNAVLRSLTRAILTLSEPDEPAAQKISDWSQARSAMIRRTESTLAELVAADRWDLATLSVAVRSLRSVVG
ncbi:NAD-glutamate dehydrogenase [Gordonia neofelifaecis]|uniref:NAD-glutamate dehydrogenase n=1 Tax=Gordonia neofelifaecis NRRL B-59395 TaxID=644548 RepID=F1YI26_9ACTN|nr:NAD-glutamate dehydrogenase domain-containing protein [Gordonia neofelifaecis]EGD55580.1 NAD-glutamate dehydrogenase [Gordonia neofelifaecis NRRL B-59395]